jgi:hypothetical protein
MFAELNSFVDCKEHMEATRDSDISTKNSPKLKELVNEWIGGEYDECPELLKQRLTALYQRTAA